ncbi:hypothetical protein Sya03_21040 [Spirilliplanes yamanashiensis]|uniref:Uncharacterized protein n=1 Tax=Spirilliplanes yamanashiensis TaxID=42233 RepID=A0A8J3Y7B1_9ACTN|nr:hypothetical protein Sya03_21040 [Spirilliplanes yamanashiensis]
MAAAAAAGAAATEPVAGVPHTAPREVVGMEFWIVVAGIVAVFALLMRTGAGRSTGREPGAWGDGDGD